MPRYKIEVIDNFTGGRNATDDPLSLREGQVAQMRNGDTYRTHLFRKRGGATAPSIGSAFTGVIGSLIAHFPNNNPASAELWGADDAATPVVGRMAGASTFSSVTLTDNLSAGAGVKMRGASYNGKLFLVYDSAVDFLHVYDPNLSAARVRRVGLATPSAPTVANSAAGGTYAATIRYYRQRYRIKHGSIVDAQSEPSSSVSFTPDGSHTAATVTKSATITESETHWVLEGSADNVTFYELAETVVGTTTYDDSADPAAYGSSSNPLSPVLGAYTRPTSAKYILAAFNRLFTLGSWETGGFQSRLSFTPAKGTSDKADDERIPNTLTVRNWVDLDEGTGGDGTGLAGPIYGAIYVFKYTQIRQVRPTGTGSPPFDVIELSPTRGAIDQDCICLGEDNQNRPTVFFMDAQVGPMMVGAVPPTEIGQGVRDIWDTVNLAATTKFGQVIDYPKLGQVWFWVSTGSANEPDTLMVYTKATGAWTVFDTGGKLRLARCAVLFARTLGSSMSRDKVPYTSYQASNNKILKGDTTDTSDDSTTYQALVKSRPYVWNKAQPFRATDPWIVAKGADGVVLTVTFSADFGRTVQTQTIDLTLDATEQARSVTRVWRQVKGIDITDAHCLEVQIGDAAAIANTWQVDRIYVPITMEDTVP